MSVWSVCGWGCSRAAAATDCGAGRQPRGGGEWRIAHTAHTNSTSAMTSATTSSVEGSLSRRRASLNARAAARRSRFRGLLERQATAHCDILPGYIGKTARTLNTAGFASIA
jgi:hypothetical protein